MFAYVSSELSFQNSLLLYFRRKLKFIHSRLIEVKKLHIIPNTQLTFMIVQLQAGVICKKSLNVKKGQKVNRPSPNVIYLINIHKSLYLFLYCMYTYTKNSFNLCLQTCWNVLMHVAEQKNCKIVKVTLTSLILKKF